MPTLEQARAQLLNRGTSSTATPISIESREVLKTQGGMTDEQIDSVVQSGDWNTTNAANAGAVGMRTSDYVAQAPSGSVFQQGPAWFYKGADGIPRHITDGGALQALLAAGIPQVASPLPANFAWEDVAREYGQLDGGAVQQIVAARQQAQQAAAQAAAQAAQAAAAQVQRPPIQPPTPTPTDIRSNVTPAAGVNLPPRSNPVTVNPATGQTTAVNTGVISPAINQTPQERQAQSTSVTTQLFAPDPTGGANRAGLKAGDSTFFGNIIGDGENGLPGGLGFNWHELRLKAILDLIDADGQMRDPVTGQVLQGQQSLAAIKQATDLARQQAQLMGRDAQGNATLEREISEGTLTGKYGGANTLERDKFEESRAQSLYNRAANPASIFENELARSSGGSVYDTVTGGVNVGQNPASVTPMQPQGVTAAGQSTQTGTFRTPAIINAYRGGLLTPQAGQINAPNTMGTAQDAALGESTVRLANQRTLMSPDQRSMVKSFASAGGVSGDQFDYLEELNKPRGRSVASVFSGR